jgi:hypothetical protein
MHNSQVCLLTVCTLAAAGACSGRDEVVVFNTGGSSGADHRGGLMGGTGGSVGGRGGTGGSSGGGAEECGGPPPPRSTFSTAPTFERIQCYISELAEGEPECLPANNPTLVARLGDYISSTGFVTQFVIDVADTIPLAPSCQPLAECCAGLSDMSKQMQCYDWLESSRPSVFVDGCPVRDSSFKASFNCAESTDAGTQQSDAGMSPSSDAGVSEGGAPELPAAPSRSQCCYHVCGYTHWI